MGKAATVTKLNEPITINQPAILEDMSDDQLEAILKARKEAKAKLALERKAEIIADVEVYLRKKYSGITLADLGLSEKTARKVPEQKTYKNEKGKTYIYKGWGAVAKEVLDEFGIKNDAGKLVLNPAFLQPAASP